MSVKGPHCSGAKYSRWNHVVGWVLLLPLTGQSKSVGRRQLQQVSYQSLEHLERILSRPPNGGETNKAEH